MPAPRLRSALPRVLRIGVCCGLLGSVAEVWAQDAPPPASPQCPIEDRSLHWLVRVTGRTFKITANASTPECSTGTLELPELAGEFRVVGARVYIVFTLGRLGVVDIAKPRQPKLLDVIEIGCRAEGLTIQGDVLTVMLADDQTAQYRLDGSGMPALLQGARQPVCRSAVPIRPVVESRQASTARGLLIAGPIVMGTSYLLTVAPVVLADTIECTPADVDCRHGLYYIPFVGPWIDLGQHAWGTTTIVPVLSGLMQATGLGLTIAGGVLHHKSKRLAPPSRPRD